MSMSNILNKVSQKTHMFLGVAPQNELIGMRLTRPLNESDHEHWRVNAWEVNGLIRPVSITDISYGQGGFSVESVNVRAGFFGITPGGLYIFAHEQITEKTELHPERVETMVWCGPDPEELASSVLRQTRLKDQSIPMYLYVLVSELDRKIELYS